MSKKDNTVLPSLESFFIQNNLISLNNLTADYYGLKKLLSNSIVEIVFKRRRWPIKFPSLGQNQPYRRMLACMDYDFLYKNRKLLKFIPPKGSKLRSPQWYSKRNLLIVFDLIRKDWRMISCTEYFIASYIKIVSIEQQTDFIQYYKELIKNKSEKELLRLFDK